MVHRKIYRKKFKKSTRRYKKAPGLSLGIAFPANKMVKMCYTDSYTMSSTTGIMAKQLLRMNSIFDPDQTGTGHQPLGHTEWNSFYNHYVVLRATLHANFTQRGGQTLVIPCAIGTFLSDDTTITTQVWSTLVESGRGDNCILPSGPDSARNCKLVYDAKKFFNVKDVKDNVTRLGAGFNANPSEEAIACIYLQPLDLTSNSQSIQVVVKIVYDVLLSEPKELPAS